MLSYVVHDDNGAGDARNFEDLLLSSPFLPILQYAIRSVPMVLNKFSNLPKISEFARHLNAVCYHYLLTDKIMCRYFILAYICIHEHVSFHSSVIESFSLACHQDMPIFGD